MAARGAAAFCGAAIVLAACGCRPFTRPPTAGFFFDGRVFPLAPATTAALGGPLTDAEVLAIEQRSRAEVIAAFAPLKVAITADPNAFWRVAVRRTMKLRNARQLPAAGESLPLGWLGGVGDVAFDFVAAQAVRYAPSGAQRQTIVDGIGRGIGRVAVHEFVHQMLGSAGPHNDADPASYEYGRPDRADQYYGTLHWTTAWPALEKKFSR